MVGEQIVVNLIDRGSIDLLAARPLVTTVVDTALDLEPFRDVFREAASQANRILFVRERDNVAFDISDASQIVKFALQQFAPELADDVPKDLDLALVSLKERDFARDTLIVADRVRLLGFVLPVAAILLFAIAIAIAPDRRTGVLRSAVAFATAGGLLAVVMIVLRARIVAGIYGADETTDEEIRGAVGGVLDAFFGELFLWSLLLLGARRGRGGRGGDARPRGRPGPARALAATGRSGVRSRAPGRPSGARSSASPACSSRSSRRARSRSPPSPIAALLLFAGAGELLHLLERRDRTAAEGTRARRHALLAAAGTGLTVVVAATVASLILVKSGEDPDAAQAGGVPGGCNGSRELCDLRIDQAVFGGTHNSFSAADSPGWFIANQRRTISRQLTDGVRLLLLDPHYGAGSVGRVSTDFEAEGREKNRVAKALPPDTLAAAERLVGHLGLGKGSSAAQREVWLCHTVCELGATRMSDALGDLRQFLERNPGEIVILFIEPYVPPDAIEETFRRAGLFDNLATLDPERAAADARRDDRRRRAPPRAHRARRRPRLPLVPRRLRARPGHPARSGDGRGDEL